MENMDLLEAMREMMANMKANRKVDQPKAEANTKANQANMERQISSLASKFDANQARMEESLKEEMRLTVSAIEGKMEAIVHSIRSERDGKIQDQSGKRSVRKGPQ
jgi:predicted phage-related endonuclease